jgi:hypothetical protein
MDDQRTDRKAGMCGRKYFVAVIAAIGILVLGTYLVWPVAKPEASSERQMRYLLTRDLLARHLQTVNIDIKRKLDEYLDIERESPAPKSYDSEFQRFNTTQLVHEISRVEQAVAIEKDRQVENDNSELMPIQKLREQQNKMLTELKSRITGGGGLASRHRDLQQLQQVAHDMAVNFENLDAEAAGVPK